MFDAVRDLIVVLPDTAPECIGRIYIPEAHRGDTTIGLVLRTGRKVQEIMLGHYVMFPRKNEACHEVSWRGTDYMVLPEWLALGRVVEKTQDRFSLTPLFDRVLIERDVLPSVSKGGIILVTHGPDRLATTGVVRAVGSEQKELKIGDKVALDYKDYYWRFRPRKDNMIPFALTLDERAFVLTAPEDVGGVIE